MILGKYRITYSNGITQFKNLISHDVYLSIIKTIEDKIYEIERSNKFKPTNESIKLKKYLKDTFGEYFTTDSPLFYAIGFGAIILPRNQGGLHSVRINKIN